MKQTILNILHRIINGLIRVREDIRFDLHDLDPDAGPYFFIGNHVTNWDPFFMNVPIPKPISFVCSERFFKIWPLGALLRLVDAVPKMKNRSDMATVRQLIRRRDEHKHIGVFPEGRRSFDGHTESLFFATAKLIKLLNMPVVAVVNRGGYLCYPRWAHTRRKGPIRLSYRCILQPKEIADMDPEQIFFVICEALEHDEGTLQEASPWVYRGRRRAEHLERLLFLCPACKTYDTLRSRRHILRCSSCGYAVRYDRHALLQAKSDEPLRFRTVSAWNTWQRERLQEEASGLLDGTVFHKPATVRTYDRERRLLRRHKGIFALGQRGLLCEGEWVDPGRLDGINIQNNYMLEFYIEDELKRVVFDDRTESVYKWTHAMKHCRKGE